MTETLRMVLGDQLSPGLSALRGSDKARDVVLMAEVMAEARYVPHHRKKIAFILAAMRAFAHELRQDGWQVRYVALDDAANVGDLGGELARAVTDLAPSRVVLTEAAEHRVLAMQRGWSETLPCPVEIRDDDRFVSSKAEFARWAEGRKQLRMEYFYRDMRRRTGILMDGDEPAGGQWNLDHDNRKPARDTPKPPARRWAETGPQTEAVLDMVQDRFADGWGDVRPLRFPVTRAGARRAAADFMANVLPGFGDHQDVMLEGERFLWHSVLSPMLNVGLLDPLDLCRAAEEEYRAGRAPLNAVEGFVRQIIGWREYVRGIYWLRGPDYLASNALEARRPLPEMYWTCETDMACMKAALTQTRQEAYAHHIQRLMVTGNFALLAGIDPHQVHEWYLSVYADAFEWVEAPNTLGMALFADGGLLASKPYAASGAYIDRMSDHCVGCRYSVKERTGPDACPFNALYWDFVARHEDRFARNPRMAQIVRTWLRMDADKRRALRAQAEGFLERLETRGTDRKAPR